MPCHYQNAACSGGSTKHHFYFPQKRFSQQEYRLFQICLCEHHHAEFNEFFKAFCRQGERFCSICGWTDICCYNTPEFVNPNKILMEIPISLGDDIQGIVEEALIEVRNSGIDSKKGHIRFINPKGRVIIYQRIRNIRELGDF